MATAYLGPPTDHATLVEFYRKVRPFGPGWRRIRRASGLSAAEAADRREHPAGARSAGSAGCAAIWSSLFTVGNLLYGRTGYAAVCGAVFAGSGFVLVRVVNRLWQAKGADAPAAA